MNPARMPRQDKSLPQLPSIAASRSDDLWHRSSGVSPWHDWRVRKQLDVQIGTRLHHRWQQIRHVRSDAAYFRPTQDSRIPHDPHKSRVSADSHDWTVRDVRLSSRPDARQIHHELAIDMRTLQRNVQLIEALSNHEDVAFSDQIVE
jgi:hypothetical protein